MYKAMNPSLKLPEKPRNIPKVGYKDSIQY
jgi:hypothetical protein